MKRHAALAGAAALLLAASLLAACGRDGAPTPAEERAAIDAAYEQEIQEDPGPKVQIPDGPPPDELVIKDLSEGSGPAASNGDTVTVMYVGINWERRRYANSWTYPEPPTFVLGTGRLPRGFEQGIIGMKEGGRRELIVPARLIFRPGIKPSTTEPGATVVFIVHMLEVRPA